jgi:hypothetical protein
MGNGYDTTRFAYDAATRSVAVDAGVNTTYPNDSSRKAENNRASDGRAGPDPAPRGRTPDRPMAGADPVRPSPAALNRFGVSSLGIYHPTVIRAFSQFFNANW